MTLEERMEKAMKYRREGYNCAQCVLLAVTDKTGLDDETSANVAMGLGGGVGGMKEICGVVTAMAVATGLAEKKPASEKAAVYADVRGLADKFSVQNDGRLLCRDLKRPGAVKTCNDLIAEGIRILHGA